MDCELNIDAWGIANNKISQRILDFSFEFSQDFAIIVEFSSKVEGLFKQMFWISLEKPHSFFIIGYFFKFHDFIVVIDCFLIELMWEKIDNMLVYVLYVENLYDLDVENVFVVFFALKLLVY